ncbi:ABC transporter ATP-binding protein [Methylobacterium persicinum]|uniref:ABC transport system ATP-binding protein n=1 Tax=Methylobacterium persicinum TaxID=374426 RepID=A0ABU0HMX3_9HYPH|nr:ABC transporter ATP-binding protein [Methylobacterium persicinum]MDQ0443674.1 putative ABC transport system ATP-binding protein [Methylobacterium persicinum]GJE36751.1 putative ABC transporter ATP-binding protein YknY [Methylobacterium persicinum]
MTGAVVSLYGIHRTFRMGDVSVPVLHDVSLDIGEGECVAVIGPSGSGKSSLMNLVGLLDRPDSGQVLIEGIETGRLTPDRRAMLRNRRIGFVFQSYNLLSRHTALANVQLPLLYAGVGRSERRRRGEQALEAVGLAHRAGHLPSRLSGGEQQRVAIARALVTDPGILLADEPTGALDSRTGSEIIGLFHGLNRAGRTILLITHDPGVAAQCGRVVRLLDGRIVSDCQQAVRGLRERRA